MSFILDALKKSENERQRTNTPGIAHIADNDKRKHAGKWIWLVAALLVVNAAVLAALMLRTDEVTEIPVVQVEVPAAAPDTTRFSEIVADAKRSRAPAIAVEAETPSTEPVSLPRAIPDARSVAQEAPPATVTDGLPSFNELRAGGILQLPDMHLDIHVYSATPEDRFVFVNMSKYKERATLDEGPLVKEITRDGVVLEHNGHAFLLPRE